MAALESLVLFESSAANARNRQALQFGFERENIVVHHCEAPSKLVGLCIKHAPQLVLISLPDGEKPIAETLAALDELRATDSVQRLPVLVLGERDLRDEVLRAGADEFVPRPAYLRDVLTLCRMVVGLRAREDKELRGLVEEFGLFFLLRALSIVGRSAVIELERVGRYAEIHVVLGEVAMARTGRMAGQAAFQHLMLWHDARLRLRLESPSAERRIFVPTLRLLEDASRFAQKFDETASRVGGTRMVFRRVVSRAAEVRETIPTEIEAFSHLCDGRRALVDIVEEAQFRPLDVIKIVHRLEKLGAIERIGQSRSTNAGNEPSVYDWLKSKGPVVTSEPRNTVTEAGRRAAEMAAEEHARRAEDRAPSDDVLPQASLLQRLGEAATRAPSGGDRRSNPQGDRQADRRGNKKKGQKHQPEPHKPAAKQPAPTAATAPSTATSATAKVKELDDQETRPFQKFDEPAAKLTASAQKAIHAKEPVFDEVEDAFFAQEADLHKVEPVENFDDLDSGLPKKPAARWSLMSLFRPATPSKPTPTTPRSSTPPSNNNGSGATKSAPKGHQGHHGHQGKKR